MTSPISTMTSPIAGSGLENEVNGSACAILNILDHEVSDLLGDTGLGRLVPEVPPEYGVGCTAEAVDAEAKVEEDILKDASSEIFKVEPSFIS